MHGVRDGNIKELLFSVVQQIITSMLFCIFFPALCIKSMQIDVQAALNPNTNLTKLFCGVYPARAGRVRDSVKRRPSKTIYSFL